MKKASSGQSLEDFNQVGEHSRLTYENMDFLLEMSFTANNSAIQYDEFHRHSHVDIAVIGAQELDDSLRDAILKFIGTPGTDKMSIALCQGELVGDAIEGDSHWTALHLRRTGADPMYRIDAYYMDSLGDHVPEAIERVFDKVNGITLQALSADLQQNGIFQTACNLVQTGTRVSPCALLDSNRQTDGYSCGYHAAFNMIRMYVSASLENIEANIRQGENSVGFNDFHRASKERLIAQFSHNIQQPDVITPLGKLTVDGYGELTKTKDVSAGKNSRGAGSQTCSGFYVDSENRGYFIKQPLDLVEAFTEGLAGEILNCLKDILEVPSIYRNCLTTAEITTVKIQEERVPILIQPKMSFAELHTKLHTSKSSEEKERSNWKEMTSRKKTPYGYYFLDGKPKYGTTHALLFSLLVGDYSVHSSNVAVIKFGGDMDLITKIDFGAAFRKYTDNNNQTPLIPYEYRSRKKRDYISSRLKGVYKDYISYYTSLPGFTDALSKTATSYLSRFSTNKSLIEGKVTEALKKVLGCMDISTKLAGVIQKNTGLSTAINDAESVGQEITRIMEERLTSIAGLQAQSLNTTFNSDTIEQLHEEESQTCLQQARLFRSYSTNLEDPKPAELSLEDYKANKAMKELILNSINAYRLGAKTGGIIHSHRSDGLRKVKALEDRIKNSRSITETDVSLTTFFKNEMRDKQGLIGGDINANPHSYISFLLNAIKGCNEPNVFAKSILSRLREGLDNDRIDDYCVKATAIKAARQRAIATLKG